MADDVNKCSLSGMLFSDCSELPIRTYFINFLIFVLFVKTQKILKLISVK